MHNLFTRSMLLLALIICLTVTIFHWHVFQFPPCPLCDLQTIAAGTIASILLLANIYPKSKTIKICGAVILLISLTGTTLAVHQYWLQQFSPEPQTCGMGLFTLLQNLPLQEALHKILQGAGTCNINNLQFLHLNIGYWRIIFFLSFDIFALWLLLKKTHHAIN